MSTWLERFFSVLATILAATVLTNPWQLDRVRQALLIVAIVSISIVATRKIERVRGAKTNSDAVREALIKTAKSKHPSLILVNETTLNRLCSSFAHSSRRKDVEAVSGMCFGLISGRLLIFMNTKALYYAGSGIRSLAIQRFARAKSNFSLRSFLRMPR